MKILTLRSALRSLLFNLPVIAAHAQASAPAPLAPASFAAAPLSDSAMGALGSDMFLQSGSTGMVLVVVREDQIFFHGYGETAPGSHQLPTQDSVLRLCSLTKIFTTDVLAKLVADGTVQRKDPLQRYAPAGVVVPERTRPITLIDLATHTAGLPRELGNAPRDTPHFTFPDERTRWRWLPHQHLRSTPGTAALYSNIGFDLLSDALQSGAHRQYAAILAARTLNPLHMQHTTFFPTAEQCALLLIGAYDQGPCTSTEQTAGSSGLYSNGADMALWLKYLLQVPSQAPRQSQGAQAVYLVPADLVSEKGLDHAGEPTGIGLGWIDILPLDSPSHIVEKTGGGAGFQTYIAINHARNTAIFFASTDGAGDSHLNLYNAANKFLLAVAGLPPLPPPTSPPLAKSVRSRRHAHRAAHTVIPTHVRHSKKKGR